MANKHENATAWTAGPGGYKCPCCGPAPKDRDRARRTARRVAKRRAAKEIKRDAEYRGTEVSDG